MIVWVLPGWEGAHPKDVLQKYGIAPSALLADMGPTIRAVWKKVKVRGPVPRASDGLVRVRFPRMEDHKINFSKLDVYSPTFLESMKAVKRTMFDVWMVTDKCPIHGRPESVARFHEMDDPDWQYLDNSELRARLVEPLVAGLKARSAKGNQSDSEEELLLLMMFETGLRLQQVGSMKVDDIEFGHDSANVNV